MNSVLNHRTQFEEGVVVFTKEVDRLTNQVSDHEAEIVKLNTELNDQKETFEKARTMVNEVNG